MPQENTLRLVAQVLVACAGGILPICNLSMISSAYLALSGDFNTDLVNLTALILGCLMMMCVTQPLTSYVQRALGLRLALVFALSFLAVCGTCTALAETLPGLGFGYALMGLGGCLYFGLSSRIIVAALPQRLWRPLVLVWMLCIGFSSSLGPLVGGLLVEHLSWHSLFLLSPLVALPALPIVLFLVPDQRTPPLPKLERLSLVLLLTVAASTVYAVCYGQTLGWNSTLIRVLLFICPAALFLLLISCLSSPTPLLNIRNLGFPGVTPALVLSVLLVTAHVGIRIEVILFGRYILGYTPAQIALLFLLPLGFYLAAIVPAGLVVSRSGPNPLFTLTGLGLLIVSGLLLSRLDANAGRWAIIFALCIDYAGYGMADATINPLIMRNIPSDQLPATLPAVAGFRFFSVTVTIGLLTPINVQLKQYYVSRLASQVTEWSTVAKGAINHWESLLIGGGTGAEEARHEALSLVQSSIQKQAGIFTFDHLFLLFALLAALAVVCLLLCHRHPLVYYFQQAAAEINRELQGLRRFRAKRISASR